MNVSQPSPQGTGETGATSEFLVEARGIVKRFGDFTANDHVDLAIRPGEIHALLGENGAGKSTLVKMIYGSLQPTEGRFFWHGEPVTIADPGTARRLGIGMVFQHFSLFEALSVTENIALALTGDHDMKALGERIARVSRDYGLPLEPRATVADLSVGERQRIEIVRCLLQEPRLLIMDEPTAVLTPQEADQLFLTLERLASEGCAVLYISHRLEEVKRLCHASTILRHGKVVARVDPSLETAASLARLMVGAEIHSIRPKQPRTGGPTRLYCDNLDLAANGPFAVALAAVTLEVRAGEILAIAGVAGNGQSELFDALSGERRVDRPGAVVIEGTPCGHLGVTARRALGAAFVPEERLGHGAVPAFRLSENVILTRDTLVSDAMRRIAGFLDFRRAGKTAARVAQTFDVRKGKPDPEARSLSGGNLQKFVVGRELDRKPLVLVVNQPTWGVDAGAAALIRQALVDLAGEGAGVLMISQDLDEIFEIAHRIAVISRGHLSPGYDAHVMSLEKIGLLMGGAHGGPAHVDEAVKLREHDGHAP
ncbi:ABC transporter ATP-binding protein [Siculibacillus lacustris]|uniref:ABC transporter ATP-binding protein n=1 Tax=Siculibacillus lacustris TaxID=1549641 RepID=A0A4Q9VNN7_9HYPH|nr:ABC transporter ATP-binding protein [Siculibacillus lacustris]TBW37189.1 ABC transporter ATP-binding protein [Siculibacillus lacustris]